MRHRRRRAVLLLGLGLATGGLAASQVHSTVEEVEARVGTPVSVVVAREDIRGGTMLKAGMLDRLLAVEAVPERYVPPDALVSPRDGLGLRVAVPIAAGSYVTLGDLETEVGGGSAGPVLSPGERVVEVGVAGAEAVAAAGPGARVDVLVTTGAESGGGRTYVALQSVEILGARPAGGRLQATGGAGAPAGTIASLRVTLRQAVLLTAAQTFAREVRLLVRPPSDERRVGPTSVEAADL